MAVALGVVVTAGMLAAYDRAVVRPAQRIAVVDVAQLWQAAEADYARNMAIGGAVGSATAQNLAADFSARLPAALERLPAECDCVVISKSALLGSSRPVLDLTPRLRELLNGG